MRALLSVVIILTALSVAVGQEKPDLPRLEENLSSQLEPRLPDWRYRRVEPFQPSSTVVVQGWSKTNRGVQVAIAVRATLDDAKKELRSFLQFNRQPQELSGFGDEAFAPEPNGYNIVLRRGRYVIYISVVVYPSESEALTLSPSQLDQRLRSEAHKALREFAKQLSSIDFP